MKTKNPDLRRRLALPARRLAAMAETRSLLLCLLLAPLLNLLIESISRHSPLQGAAYLLQHPVSFMLGSLMILVTLLAAAVFPKRLFTILLAAVLWLWCGVVNGVLLSMRVTPFGFADFRNIEAALDIIDIYMTPWQIALCAAAAVLCILLLVLLYIKSPRFRPRWVQGAACLAAGCLICAGFGGWSIRSGRVSEEFGNLADAYKEYGFVYCFAKSIFDQGVDRPDSYSDARIDDIVEDLEEAEPEPPAAVLEHPNIIIVQLESFFNVNRMAGLTFSSQPLPNFTRLAAENPSGFLSVPSIGAGTVNTEFEVLTGMSLEYFGTGEYPYKTILRESVCPSLCYDLDGIGYTNYAIHNNNGTFYDRHKVYPNLGFDYFLPVEYMDNIRENILGWSKDSILTEQILKCLDNSPGSDFVYTVSVQPHGRYPQTAYYTEEEGGYAIRVSGLETQEETNQWEYYVSQLYGTDAFVGALIQALDSRGEPYICVFYGDHLPSLDIQEEDLLAGDLFQTEYVICTNTGLTAPGGDIEAYQLSAAVLEMAGLPGGVLPVLHQTARGDADYQEQLELLEYDLLYGDQTALGGSMPFAATDMQMGVDPITIRSAVLRSDGLYVYCDNITDASYVFLNGKPFGETQRIDRDTLFVAGDDAEPGDVVSVVQMGNDGEPLSYTNEYLLN